MLATTHTLVGASIGRAVKDPIAALVLAILSHFILDKINHFWPTNKSIRFQFGILAFEWAVAMAIILWLSDNPDYYYSQFIGAIGGFLPDVVLLPFVKTKIGAWHAGRQTHTQKIIDVILEGGFIVVSISILFLFRSQS